MLSNAQAIDLFLDMLAAERGISANTHAAYRQDLEKTAKLCAEPLAALGSDALQGVLAAVQAQNLARASQARLLSCLRQFYRFLQDENYRSDDPTQPLLAPSLDQSLPRTLTKEEMQLLLQTAYKEVAHKPTRQAVRLVALLELLYGSGLRASEVIALPRAALRTPTPTPTQSLVIRGKGNKERMVILSRPALQALEAWSAFVPATSPYLFPAGRNRQTKGKASHLSRIRLFQLLRAVALEAGMPPERVSPHVLRHAFATHLLEGGADLRVVQTLLGHTTIATTQIYTHISNSHLQEAVLTRHPLARPRVCKNT
jgi:integrase/recombinase XerD